MIKRLASFAVLACVSVTLAVPALAAEHGGKSEKAPKHETKKAEGKPAEKKEPPKKKPAPKKEEGEGKVGYSTTVIQLMPMMAPYRTSSGVRYELLSVRLELPPDDNPRSAELQRGACFMIPIVHEKMLLFLSKAKLQEADFHDQRREVLAKRLLDVATDTTDRSMFTGLKLVDATAPPLKEVGSDAQIVDSDPPLSQRSQTLTAECK